MSTGVPYQYWEPRPRSAYRQLFIKGTRIQAELIYRAHISVEEPMTAEELNLMLMFYYSPALALASVALVFGRGGGDVLIRLCAGYFSCVQRRIRNFFRRRDEFE